MEGLAEAATELRDIVASTHIASLLHGGTRDSPPTSSCKATAHESRRPARSQPPAIARPRHRYSGYILDFGVRKLFMGLLRRRSGRVSWADVTPQGLRAVSADQGEYLRAFPCSWSAADISTLLFGRDDVGPFVTMWPCLFHDIKEHARGNKPATRADLRRYQAEADAGKYAGVVNSYEERHGVVPCPFHASTEARA